MSFDCRRDFHLALAVVSNAMWNILESVLADNIPCRDCSLKGASTSAPGTVSGTGLWLKLPLIGFVAVEGLN